MPQVSERPPPYSREWPSCPPPLQTDVGHRAWAFQCAFENTREIVRYSVLQTFKAWQGDWALKGQNISRGDLQQAYSQAPEDLKQAVEWQVKWDSPVVMVSDHSRRWHEYVRRREAGTHEDILSVHKFEQEYDAASPATQRAVQLTVSAWTSYNGPARLEPPERDRLASVIEDASPSLKLALCFVLKMGLDLPYQRMQTIDEKKASIQQVVAQHRARVPAWDVRGKAAGLW
ncbi:unnamed protein product [Peniophora sp. CBMAI 1063]|nr:unnamed protein product [Peniophora sp. CBMAI 1063]